MSGREALDTDVAIETPEHVVFRYRVAGPARRALGHVFDLLLCYGAVLLLGLVVVLALPGRSPESSIFGGLGKAAFGFVLLALFAVQWLYFVVWEARYGRSPGKMAVGVRVVTTSGRPIGWRAAALRNLLRVADMLPVGYVVGVTSMALSTRFQRLGDLAAGTMVVAPEKPVSVTTFELAPEAEPHELATLPAHISLDADERAAIEMFLRRRPTLGRARELELASMIARPLGERLGYAHDDPVRLLSLVYARAVDDGRSERPSSPWRPRRPSPSSTRDVP